MSKKVFTSQKITLILAGKEFRLQVLVSPFGAKYVFDEGDLPQEAKECIGSEVQATYKGIPVRCRFIRETNMAGSIYDLRFLNPSSLLVRQIEKDVSVSGLPSPWMRGLPRLPTTSKNLPVPVLASINFGTRSAFLNVRNFTLGGLLLESAGSDFSDLKIGARLDLDLVTNGGQKLPDISTVVTHISEELNDSLPEQSRYQFGVKFVGMAALTEVKFRGMIREHCQALKVELDRSSATA